MAKHKIKKNLSDADMMKAFMATTPEETFEEKMLKQDKGKVIKSRVEAPRKASQGPNKNEFYREFLTEHVEAQIGKALLDLKMEYFREGEGAFSIHVRRDGKNIVLETAPKKVK